MSTAACTGAIPAATPPEKSTGRGAERKIERVPAREGESEGGHSGRGAADEVEEPLRVARCGSWPLRAGRQRHAPRSTAVERGKTVGLFRAVLVRGANRSAQGVVWPHLPRPGLPETRSRPNARTRRRQGGRRTRELGSPTLPQGTPFRLALSRRPSPFTFPRCAVAQQLPPT